MLELFKPDNLAKREGGKHTLLPDETGLSRPLTLAVTRLENTVSELSLTDAAFPHAFHLNVYRTKDLAGSTYLSHSLRTRTELKNKKHYPFITEKGYHPDLHARMFMVNSVLAAEEGIFGPIDGVCEKMAPIHEMGDEFLAFMQASQTGVSDIDAARQTKTADFLRAIDYDVRLVKKQYGYMNAVETVYVFLNRVKT